LDITDHAAVRRTIREAQPDVILLAAADAWVERCEREPEATRRVNVDAPRVIAAESRDAGALLVVFSSEYVFDGTAGRYSEAGAPRRAGHRPRRRAPHPWPEAVRGVRRRGIWPSGRAAAAARHGGARPGGAAAPTLRPRSGDAAARARDRSHRTGGGPGRDG